MTFLQGQLLAPHSPGAVEWHSEMCPHCRLTKVLRHFWSRKGRGRITTHREVRPEVWRVLELTREWTNRELSARRGQHYMDPELWLSFSLPQPCSETAEVMAWKHSFPFSLCETHWDMAQPTRKTKDTELWLSKFFPEQQRNHKNHLNKWNTNLIKQLSDRVRHKTSPWPALNLSNKLG